MVNELATVNKAEDEIVVLLDGVKFRVRTKSSFRMPGWNDDFTLVNLDGSVLVYVVDVKF